MAIAYNTTAGTGTFTNGVAQTAVAMTLPGSPTDGDVLVAGIAWQNSTSPPTMTAPAGWTAFLAPAQSAAATAGTVVGMWFKKWATGDPLVYTWTLSTSRLVAGYLRAYTGVRVPTPLDHASLSAVGTAVTSLSVTASAASAGALLLGTVGTSNTAAVTPPGATTEVQELVSSTYRCEAAEETVASPGGGLVRQWTFASANAALMVVVLRPASVADPTWYVRPDGSDANLGTGPAASQAFATIGKALGPAGMVQNRERVYLAPGTYRETVVAGTLDALPVATSPWLEVRGDPEATRFTDLAPGPVVWTAYTAGDAAAPAAAACYAAGGRSNLHFQAVQFVGGNPAAGATCLNGGSAQTSITLQLCHFSGGKQAAQALVDLYTTALGAGSWHWVDSCVFDTPAAALGLQLFCAASASGADQDAGIEVRNCVFAGGTAGLQCTLSGSGTFRTGGIRVHHNTFWRCTTGVAVATATAGSYAHPVRCVNNLLADCGTGFNGGTSGSGTLVEEFNLNLCPSPRTNVLGGASDVTGIAYAKGLDAGHTLVSGRRPRPLGSPLPGSPALGWGHNQLAARPPTASADDASVGTVAWSSTSSALQLDSVRATAVAVPAATGVTHYLVLTGFGLSVPADATLLGVRVEVMASGAAASSIRFNAVRLVKGGVISGDDKAAENAGNLASTDAMFGFGTAGVLWGLTLTPADVNGSTFGVAISMKNIHATVATDARVDFAKVVVAYTPVATDPDYDLTWGPRPAGGQLLPAAGAYECAGTMVEDGTVYRTAGPSGRLTGPGYQDFDVPVEAATTAVRVYARKNAAYTGQEPLVGVLNGAALGLSPATPSAALTVGADTWEQLSVAIAPARAGVLRVRLESRSTAAAGAVWFDDVETA